MSRFSKWMTYLNERSPVAALTFLSAGIGISSMIGTGVYNWWLFALSVVFNNLIFIQMRLGDELKDFENDKIINPTRPLPRGLLTPAEVYKNLKGLLAVLLSGGLLLGIVFGAWAAALAFMLTTIFAWLMFKEFYIGQKLSKSPMLYALTHQIIVFPLFGWFTLLLNVDFAFNTFFIGWLLANFGASFTFEICRKLNPDAHKLAGTYAHHYGRPQTALFVLIFILYSVLGSLFGGFLWYTLPVLILLMLSLIWWVKAPGKYKIPAGLSALSSAIILWAPALMALVKRFA